MRLQLPIVPQTRRDCDNTFGSVNVLQAPKHDRMIFPGWGPKLFASIATLALCGGALATSAFARPTIHNEESCAVATTDATVDVPPARWQ